MTPKPRLSGAQKTDIAPEVSGRSIVSDESSRRIRMPVRVPTAIIATYRPSGEILTSYGISPSGSRIGNRMTPGVERVATERLDTIVTASPTRVRRSTVASPTIATRGALDARGIGAS